MCLDRIHVRPAGFTEVSHTKCQVSLTHENLLLRCACLPIMKRITGDLATKHFAALLGVRGVILWWDEGTNTLAGGGNTSSDWGRGVTETKGLFEPEGRSTPILLRAFSQQQRSNNTLVWIVFCSDLDWSPEDCHLLATCSVDNFTYVWDTRDFRKPSINFETAGKLSSADSFSCMKEQHTPERGAENQSISLIC